MRQLHAATDAQLILASASPRRRALLSQVGIVVDVRPSNLPELPEPNEKPDAFALRIAQQKADVVSRSVRTMGDDRPVLAADTTVILDDVAIGKPTNRDCARRMLETLSGRTHRVVSALCLRGRGGEQWVDSVSTQVSFRQPGPGELEQYLDLAAWSDKAGAYAIQAEGACLVDRIEGSFTNVVGLPVGETLALLANVDVFPP